jgi:hypothetical protein
MQLQSLVAGLTKAEGVITSAALSGVVARRSSMLPKENADESTHGLAQLREFTQDRGALLQSDSSKPSDQIGRPRTGFLTLEHIQQRDK